MTRKILVPDACRYLTLYGIEYFIPWEDMHPGCSFFIKTTATAPHVKRELTRLGKPLGMEVETAQRVEFGYYGVRAWRV